MDDYQAKVRRLSQLLEGSRSAVFLGGAGVSTESGIPDFRSEGGHFAAMEKYGRPPEWLLSRTALMQQPQLFFEYYKAALVHTDARPNDAHRALARLEAEGRLLCVATQNIDGLHQAAGSRNVLELHGSAARNYCMDCGEKYSARYVLDAKSCRPGSHVPLCAKCGGVVRPDVVLYEENLDTGVLTSAARAIARADLLIVGGTSLAVYPAAGLLQYFDGGSLVIINKSPTPYDSRAHLVIDRPIGRTLAAAVGLA